MVKSSSLGLILQSEVGMLANATVATLVAVAVTILAVGLVAFQVRSLRAGQRSRVNAYVIVYLDDSGISPHFHDLVIRNFGEGAAHDVEIEMNPLPERSENGGRSKEAVAFPSRIPLLVPGQEWRTFWDFAPDRTKADLPSVYRARVSYRERDGTRQSCSYELDWSINVERQWVTRYGLHDVAKALREIERQMRNWKDSGGRGLQIFAYDADERDERRRQRHRDHLAQQEQPKESGEIPEEPG